MRIQAHALSLALHVALLGAMLASGPEEGQTPPPDTGSHSIQVFVPLPGTPAARRTDGGTGGAAPAPGSRDRLKGVTVVVDDRHLADLLATLRRWHGRLSACEASGHGILRVFLYDPDLWVETRGSVDIPCADFPAEFRAALGQRIQAQAGGRAVERVTLGFDRKAPGGFRILRIGA